MSRYDPATGRERLSPSRTPHNSGSGFSGQVSDSRLLMTVDGDDSEPVILDVEGDVVTITPPDGSPFSVDRTELFGEAA